MIVVVGIDTADRVLSALSAQLVRSERAHRTVALGSVELFGAVFEARADTLIALEPIPNLGDAPSDPGDALIRAALAATRAPGVRKLVLLTARAADDPVISLIKRDGAPYTVVRAAPIARLEADGALTGRRVLIRSAVPEHAQQACTTGQVAEAVLQASDDPQAMGQVIELGLEPSERIARLVREAGGKPIVTDGWKAKGLRWIGTKEVVATAHGAAILR